MRCPALSRGRPARPDRLAGGPCRRRHRLFAGAGRRKVNPTLVGPSSDSSVSATGERPPAAYRVELKLSKYSVPSSRRRARRRAPGAPSRGAWRSCRGGSGSAASRRRWRGRPTSEVPEAHVIRTGAEPAGQREPAGRGGAALARHRQPQLVPDGSRDAAHLHLEEGRWARAAAQPGEDVRRRGLDVTPLGLRAKLAT